MSLDKPRRANKNSYFMSLACDWHVWAQDKILTNETLNIGCFWENVPHFHKGTWVGGFLFLHLMFCRGKNVFLGVVAIISLPWKENKQKKISEPPNWSPHIVDLLNNYPELIWSLCFLCRKINSSLFLLLLFD